MIMIVKRYWEMSDEVTVDADSVQLAIDKAHALPLDNNKAHYVTDSMNTDPESDLWLVPGQQLNQTKK